MRFRQGFALAIVLLVSMVALGAVMTSVFFASVSSQQVVTSQRRATGALLAAESGLNTVAVRSKVEPTKYDGNFYSSIQSWLNDKGLNSYTLDNGATVQLSVLNENDTAHTVTLQSVGTMPNGSQRVVIETFELATTVTRAGLFANAALITQGNLQTNSNNSKLIGRDAAEGSWIFDGRTLADAVTGDYFQVGSELYRVVNGEPDGDGNVEAKKVDSNGDLASDSTFLPETTQGSLIPFALSSGISGGTSAPDRIDVTSADLYTAGTKLYVGDGVATVTGVQGSSLDVSWDTPPTSSLEQGTPVRTEIPSVIAGSACPSSGSAKLADKLPQGCYLADLSNLFEKTFLGSSKGSIYQLAEDNHAVYGPDSSVDWPTGSVSGVTWIDGAQTSDFNSNGKNKSSTTTRGLCGSGVVVLNTGVLDPNAGANTTGINDKINLNVSNCTFSGVLYVIGELGIEGNVDGFSGAIIVETGQGTKVQGTGTKALYDPIAIRNALANLSPPSSPSGIVGPIPSTWRFGKR